MNSGLATGRTCNCTVVYSLRSGKGNEFYFVFLKMLWLLITIHLYGAGDITVLGLHGRPLVIIHRID